MPLRWGKRKGSLMRVVSERTDMRLVNNQSSRSLAIAIRVAICVAIGV